VVQLSFVRQDSLKAVGPSSMPHRPQTNSLANEISGEQDLLCVSDTDHHTKFNGIPQLVGNKGHDEPQQGPKWLVDTSSRLGISE